MIRKASGKGLMEPRFNEPLYKEDFGITNDILHASNSKIHGKRTSLQQIKASLLRTYFVCPVGLRYIEVPL